MKKYSPAILLIGLLLLAVGVLMPILSGNIQGMAFRYVFAAGALLAFAARILAPAPPKSLPLRIKRLLRIESWSTVLFCVAAFFTFYDTTQIRDWLAFTLAGAALQVYSSIALSLALRKLDK